MGDAIPRDAREVYYDEHGKPIAYCPKEGLGLTDLERGMFFRPHHERCLELAARARQKTRETGVQQLVVCISVDDRTWSALVEALMPDHDWAPHRERGEALVAARGVVPAAPIAGIVEDLYPAAGVVPTDEVSIVVFAAGGVSVVRV